MSTAFGVSSLGSKVIGDSTQSDLAIGLEPTGLDVESSLVVEVALLPMSGSASLRAYLAVQTLAVFSNSYIGMVSGSYLSN